MMIEAALDPIYAALATMVSFGAPVALKSSGTDAHAGMYLCAEQGGPQTTGQPFDLTGRLTANVWETWTLDRGKPPSA
jgi:hypothetical protein